MASIHAQRGELARAKEEAAQAEQLLRETGSAEYAADTLSILCLCHAAEHNWATFDSYEAKALSVSEEVGHTELKLLCFLNLARAYIQVAAWYDEAKGEPPPLTNEQAVERATDYANKAESLAEAKAMRGLLKKAKEVLAEIGRRR